MNCTQTQSSTNHKFRWLQPLKFFIIPWPSSKAVQFVNLRVTDECPSSVFTSSCQPRRYQQQLESGNISNSNSQAETFDHGNSTTACAYARETMEVRESLCFCQCISAVQGAKLSTKSARDCSKSLIGQKKETQALEQLLEEGVGKMCPRLQ